VSRAPQELQTRIGEARSGFWNRLRAATTWRRSQRHCSVAIELDQPRVTDPEVMRDLVEHDVSDLAAQTIGIAGSGSRDRSAEGAGRAVAGSETPRVCV
jgi:hypothetical protein